MQTNWKIFYVNNKWKLHDQYMAKLKKYKDEEWQRLSKEMLEDYDGCIYDRCGVLKYFKAKWKRIMAHSENGVQFSMQYMHTPYDYYGPSDSDD